MKNKFQLHWTNRIIADGIGNAFGYTVHTQTLYKYVSRIAQITDKAKAAVSIVSPEMYKEAPKGYINFLFTMFEGMTLPDIYLENMAKADFLIAPSTWVKSKFDEYFPSEKSFICPHGCEPRYSLKKRKFPQMGEPFIYLWVGAPNPRKGYEELIVVWKHMGFLNSNRVKLYIKTTRVGKLEQNGNVILDGRRLTFNQLANLYKRAHCFVMAHHGEGWGLTLMEAMRTGCPCIATNFSGVTDFFDEKVGYPIGYEIKDSEITFPGTGMKHKTKIAMPNIDEISEKMIYVYENYTKALRKGLAAHKRVAQKFTWGNSARMLVDGMKEKLNE